MNTGIVASRYAAALLKYAVETGNGEKVYEQVLVLDKSLTALPRLRSAIDNPMNVPDPQKFALLVSALGGDEMVEELQRFIRLVMKKRRTRLLQFIFRSFIRQYREANRIKVSRLVTATPDPELEKKISAIIKERKGDSVLFEHRIDPEIIGGFIFDIDGLRLDASTASQLKSVRRQFIEKNRRIV